MLSTKFRLARRIFISPEYSAQRRSAPPNPALRLALDALGTLRGGRLQNMRVADQGCGKLRHYRLLRRIARALYLVDTARQLSAIHRDGGSTFRITDFARKENTRSATRVGVLTDREFGRSRLRLDIVFSIAVLDVVPSRQRRAIVHAAARNLRSRGWLVLIIPRNDSSILHRCGPENRYGDGYVFPHHGVFTFYRNFHDVRPLVRECGRAGLELVQDLSSYRQICLLLRRDNRA